MNAKQYMIRGMMIKGMKYMWRIRLCDEYQSTGYLPDGCYFENIIYTLLYPGT